MTHAQTRTHTLDDSLRHHYFTTQKRSLRPPQPLPQLTIMTLWSTSFLPNGVRQHHNIPQCPPPQTSQCSCYSLEHTLSATTPRHSRQTTQYTVCHYITEFRNSIRLQPSSVSTSHPFITGSLNSTDNNIMAILDTYNSPFILTIDESFKPHDTYHIYPPRQPQHPTLAHAAASVTITAINNSHPTKQWMVLPSIPLLAFNLSPLRMAPTMSRTTQLNSWYVSWHTTSFLKIHQKLLSTTPPLSTTSISHYLDISTQTDNGQGRYFKLVAVCLHNGLKRPVHGSHLTTQHTTVTPTITMIPHPHS